MNSDGNQQITTLFFSDEAKKQISQMDSLKKLKFWWQEISERQQQYRSNRFALIDRVQEYGSIFEKENIGLDLFS